MTETSRHLPFTKSRFSPRNDQTSIDAQDRRSARTCNGCGEPGVIKSRYPKCIPSSALSSPRVRNTLMELKANIKALTQNYAELPEDINLKNSLDIAEKMEDKLELTEVSSKIISSKLENVPKLKKNNNNGTVYDRLPELPFSHFWGKYEG
ncbi:hypothetical protein NPIL_52091 [Nephila pilipes]|uniref:Uncharacterized protein n=1 Tax=Nephila pilipes TaxID=299642 RepID=A0A8X6TRH4_NEPPI|nr:hypothetical protein NPIL_52091 [Nephila pilipes]